MIAAIIGGVIERIGARLTAAAAIEDPVEAVRSILTGGFAIMDEYGDLMATLVSGHMPAACKAQFEKQDEIALTAAIIRKGITAGAFRSDLDPLLAAALLIGTLVPWNYQQPRVSHSVAQISAGFLDLCLNGVKVAAP